MAKQRAAAPSPNSAWQQPKVLLPILGVLGAAALAFGILFALFRESTTAINETVVQCDPADPRCVFRKATHQHADFALFIRGQKFDFDKPEFISTEGNERSDLAHIHEPRSTVVHVHTSGTTWNEFFQTIGFKIADPTLVGTEDATTCLATPDGQQLCNTATEKLRFIVNGVRVDGVAQSFITDLDRVLISYGSETDAQLQAQYAQVTDQACIPSERCKDRIPPDEPPEECSLSDDSCVKPGG
jgi:hypothetical protein